ENFSGRVLGPRTHVDEFFHDLLPGRVQLRQRQCLQSQGVPFFGGGLALGRRKQDEHVGVSTRTRVDGPVHAMTLSESSTPCVGMTTAADPRGTAAVTSLFCCVCVAMDVTPAVPWLTLVCGVLALVELVGLVLAVHGALTYRVVVLAHVVRTAQKRAAGVQQHPNVSLCTTAVATVGSRQRLGGGKGSSHFAILNTRR